MRHHTQARKIQLRSMVCFSNSVLPVTQLIALLNGVFTNHYVTFNTECTHVSESGMHHSECYI